ncbi:uncharacterized protein B0P05DRAFT_373352 [Gilbertella persicaria]|uniref:uncharacterized protein n=1 Tax=Gilbertella persicaria TaxID=101096 RepID=UPI00221E6E02|nr:uncharacterized protein B0P05DRAFT_373352 [Gilbertella persicaria]KAI8087761.1 hypothetical protein B0P05DRAFT_373352 [Gilbertella persicaria]
MEKKVQEQQEVTKRKDLEILELKRQLSMLRPKAVTEKRAFPAEKPAPRKIYKRSTHSPKQSQSSSVDQPVAVVPPSVQLPVNENQENYKLLRVLYSDIFIEWNNKNHNGTKDFESCVHHTELIDMFVSQCMPESHESNVTLDQFGLMADQIKHTIQDSKQPHQTIPILLHQLHFCLSISIENRLYKTIQHLSNIIHRLTCAFIEAKEYMYQELMLYPPSSLVYTMANALSLFRFTQLPPEISILDNHPDIQNNNNISFTRIMELAELYNMLPSQICSLIDAEKTPDETLDTVKSILESFIHLGLTYQEPLFVFLLTHEGFLELISTATPWLVLMKACHVLNTNYVDKQWSDIEWRSDKPLKAIQKLFDLLDIPGASIGKEKVSIAQDGT